MGPIPELTCRCPLFGRIVQLFRRERASFSAIVMLQEYLNRTLFVCLHGGLLALYFILLGRSYFQLRRERSTLRRMAKQMNGELDEGGREGHQYLARLRVILEGGHPTALRRQLRAIVGTTTAGEDFNTQRVMGQLGATLAAADDVIRFSINGLVIVGLIGTLYAFYEMWGTHGIRNLTAGNSTVYLESMSTALLVSLVGLFLALITNFLFALLRARRQAFLEEVATFLIPVAGLVPTDAKTHLLMTKLLAPLNDLVAQLTRQNDDVLRRLTEAVHSRTEQLNKLISQATADWQAVLGSFRAETLTAVTKLQEATGRLADSSHHVAGTMKDVSQALERTKDIGRLVNQLEASSGQIITTISARLHAASDDWLAIQNLSAQAYRSALQEQSDTVTKVSNEMSSVIRNEFNALVSQTLADLHGLKEQLAGSLGAADQKLAGTLDGFSAKFTESLEALSAKWMTEVTAVTESTTSKLGGIVDGWQTSVEGTASTVNTTLGGSRELVKEMKDSVTSLSRDLESLQSLARSMSETSGAPVYMAQAVERLGHVTESLAVLSAKLDYGQALHQLQDAFVAGHEEMRAVGRQVKELAVVHGQAVGAVDGVAEKLDGLDRRFKGFDTKLTALRSDVSQLEQGIKRRSTTTTLKPQRPQGFWQRLRQRFRPSPEPSEDGAQPASPKQERSEPQGVDASSESDLEKEGSV